MSYSHTLGWWDPRAPPAPRHQPRVSLASRPFPAETFVPNSVSPVVGAQFFTHSAHFVNVPSTECWRKRWMRHSSSRTSSPHVWTFPAFNQSSPHQVILKSSNTVTRILSLLHLNAVLVPCLAVRGLQPALLSSRDVWSFLGTRGRESATSSRCNGDPGVFSGLPLLCEFS